MTASSPRESGRLPGRVWFADRLPLLVVIGIGLYTAVAQLVLHLPLLYSLAALFAGIACVAVVLRPIWAYYVFVASLTGELLFGINEVLTLAKFMGGLLFFAWMLDLLFRHRFRLPRAPVLMMGPLLLISAMISLSVARDTAAGLARLSTIVQLNLFLFITATIIQTPRELRRVGAVFVGSTSLASLWGIVQVLRGAQSDLEGFGINRNLMGILISISIPILFSFFRKATAPKRVLLLGVAGIFALAQGMSGSRVGFLSLGLATLLSIVLVVRVGRTKMVVALGALFLTVATFLPRHYLQRVGGIEQAVVSGTDTVGLRYQLWRISMHMIRDYPYFGVGPGNYFGEFMRYGGSVGVRRAPLISHNAYLSVSVELGLVGGTVFTLFLLSAMWTSWRASRLARGAGAVELMGLTRAIGISILVFSLAVLSASGEYLKPLWLLLGLSAASLSLARSAAREAEASGGAGPGADPVPG